MKLLKKMSALLVAVVMMAVTVVPAFAYSITVNDDDFNGRTFEAYQIFKGEKVEGGSGANANTLVGIEWGNGIDQNTFLEALKSKDTSNPFGTAFANATTAADVANVLKNWEQPNDLNVIAFAQLAYQHKRDSAAKEFIDGKLENIDPGYYLIVDTSTNLDEGEAKNPAILKVVGDEVVTPKAPTIPLDKKVKGENDSSFLDDTTSCVGKIVDFQFTTTVPNQTQLNQYTVYKWVFTDTMTKGLKPVTNRDGSLKVEIKLGETTLTDGFIVSAISGNEKTGSSFTITFDNLKTIDEVAGKVLTVSYQAEVTEEAIGNTDGTVDKVENKVKLDYSNNPNDATSTDDIEDKVTVFTFQLEGTKVNNKDHDDTLSGAEFMLYKTVKDSDPVAKEYAVIDESGKITKWDTLTDDKVTEYLENKEKEDYNGPNYTITSGEDGKFNVYGLGNGTYYLQETKAPDGYQIKNDPFTIVINSTQNNHQLDSLTIQLDSNDEEPGNTTTGIVKGDFENTSSITLPETGGMGTTLLYVAGGILLIGSAVLLVTKKRMGHEN